jgi:hypothetical protein
MERLPPRPCPFIRDHGKGDSLVFRSLRGRVFFQSPLDLALKKQDACQIAQTPQTGTDMPGNRRKT